MKKLLGLCLCCSSLAAFAATPQTYSLQVNNQSAQQITINNSGNVVCTVAASSSAVCTLGAYTSYQATYPGQWAAQGLFTIQKYTTQVLQTTPVLANAALTGFKIGINADGKTGWVNTFLSNGASQQDNTLCKTDAGGVTCTLSSGDNLQTLTLTISTLS